MPNSNCLEGIRCPNCGYEDKFVIAASVFVEVTDDGTEDCGGDYEWDDNSYCQCCNCDTAGGLSLFYITNQPEKREEPNNE